jgi:integrative and conjugative element protein (TIGR02256 family)
MKHHNLWISSKLHQLIVDEVEKWAPFETGGVLMGYTGVNGDVVVTDLISDGPNSTHGRFRFKPDQEYQLNNIEYIYTNSNGRITYLGDWHSHPNSYPILSLLDKRTLTKIALTKESKCMHPVMMIYGKLPDKWSVNVVRFNNGVMRIWPFCQCEYEVLDCIID